LNFSELFETDIFYLELKKLDIRNLYVLKTGRSTLVRIKSGKNKRKEYKKMGNFSTKKKKKKKN
jgi:hypothetical protein